MLNELRRFANSMNRENNVLHSKIICEYLKIIRTSLIALDILKPEELIVPELPEPSNKENYLEIIDHLLHLVKKNVADSQDWDPSLKNKLKKKFLETLDTERLKNVNNK